MDIKFEMIIVYFLGLASGVFVVFAVLFMRKIGETYVDSDFDEIDERRITRDENK